MDTKIIGSVVMDALSNKASTATKYISPTLRITAAVRSDEKGHTEVLVTIGSPNAKQREYVKTLKKAKEPFPVKRVQYTFKKKKA